MEQGTLCKTNDVYARQFSKSWTIHPKSHIISFLHTMQNKRDIIVFKRPEACTSIYTLSLQPVWLCTYFIMNTTIILLLCNPSEMMELRSWWWWCHRKVLCIVRIAAVVHAFLLLQRMVQEHLCLPQFVITQKCFRCCRQKCLKDRPENKTPCVCFKMRKTHKCVQTKNKTFPNPFWSNIYCIPRLYYCSIFNDRLTSNMQNDVIYSTPDLLCRIQLFSLNMPIKSH